MKDFDNSEDYRILFGCGPNDSAPSNEVVLKKIKAALVAFGLDRHHSLHDNIAAYFTYEEVIGVLLEAELVIKEHIEMEAEEAKREAEERDRHLRDLYDTDAS